MEPLHARTQTCKRQTNRLMACIVQASNIEVRVIDSALAYGGISVLVL